MLLGHSGFEGYFSAGAGYLVIRMGCWRINAPTHQRTNIWFKRRDTWLCDFGKNRWQMADGSFLGSVWMSYALQITVFLRAISNLRSQFSRERNMDWQENKKINISIYIIYYNLIIIYYIYTKNSVFILLLLHRKLRFEIWDTITSTHPSWNGWLPQPTRLTSFLKRLSIENCNL